MTASEMGGLHILRWETTNGENYIVIFVFKISNFVSQESKQVDPGLKLRGERGGPSPQLQSRVHLCNFLLRSNIKGT